MHTKRWNLNTNLILHVHTHEEQCLVAHHVCNDDHMPELLTNPGRVTKLNTTLLRFNQGVLLMLMPQNGMLLSMTNILAGASHPFPSIGSQESGKNFSTM